MKQKLVSATWLVAALMIGFTANASEGALDKVASTLDWGGDLRYRVEQIQYDDDDSKEDRNRDRFRLRVGAKANVSDSVKVGFQLASGEASATSTNQTMDDGFSNKPFEIDKAYFDFTAHETTHLIGGKMGNPLYLPGKSDLMWDSDLTPEGLAVNFSTGEDTTIFVNLANFWANERSGSDSESSEDLTVGALQLGVTFMAGADSKITLGGGLYEYSNFQEKETLGSGNANDNTTVTTGTAPDTTQNYVTEFKISQVFLEFKTKLGGHGFKVFADYAANNGDEADANDEHSAYLAGLEFGGTKVKGDWSVRYVYKEIGKDSVVAAFTDGDFGDGGTDAKGHVLSGKYLLADNVAVNLTQFLNERILDTDGVDTRDYNRTQLDFVFNF